MTAESGSRGNVRCTNVLVVGVGGQGVLLASEVLAEVALLSGLDVKKSEVHGMAQRGGSVVSHVRFGRKVHSPLIELGEADFLVSFEKLETLRYLGHLHPGSWVLINDQEVLPLPVSSGKARYPGGVEKTVRKAGLQVKVIDGPDLAERAGNRRAVNSVVLGVLSQLLSFPEEAWSAALQGHVPPRHLTANMSAFRLGRRRRVG
jgi:indolepyruvate ferredoxin oxidoreductase beta subunit